MPSAYTQRQIDPGVRQCRHINSRQEVVHGFWMVCMMGHGATIGAAWGAGAGAETSITLPQRCSGMCAY